MDPNWRPTLFDVESYPILRDIARLSESAPRGQAAFVDSNGAHQNIDHDAGGLSSQNHWLSVFPVQGQDHRTCDYIQLAGVSGQKECQVDKRPSSTPVGTAKALIVRLKGFLLRAMRSPSSLNQANGVTGPTTTSNKLASVDGYVLNRY
ncbi:hypothetical protein MRX96_048391 [Rhipicephalus microplus]